MPRRPVPPQPVAAARRDRVPVDALSFCDFVDDALFHPSWGYYSTGGVRFGFGGHYDTYPLALSPLFGHMVAHYAFQAWRRGGTPASFEICELGAGNGQLCLDTLLWTHERGRHDRRWKAFAERVRYRILERSPALIARQRQQLGPLAEWVRWARVDLARGSLRATPFGARGVIVANEVLDCLPHHRLVSERDGTAGVVFVVAELGGQPLSRAQLAAVMARADRRPRIRFREVLVPLHRLPRLATFIRRRHPEVLADGAAHCTSFASPRVETLVRNAARLYEHADALWIDYGDARDTRRRPTGTQRIFVGPPRSGARLYDDPGRDDITFLVDFSAVMDAARDSGWTVAYYGAQAELARRTRVRLGRDAVERIIRHRALGWLLALSGVGPERSWHRGAVTWSSTKAAGRVPVRRYVERSVREFLSERGSLFKLLITRR